jgi:hypothetical protein
LRSPRLLFYLKPKEGSRANSWLILFTSYFVVRYTRMKTLAQVVRYTRMRTLAQVVAPCTIRHVRLPNPRTDRLVGRNPPHINVSIRYENSRVHP